MASNWNSLNPYKSSNSANGTREIGRNPSRSRRLAAWLLDLGWIGFLNMLPFAFRPVFLDYVKLLNQRTHGSELTATSIYPPFHMEVLYWLAGPLTAILIFMFFSLRSTTPGKRMLGLIIVNENNLAARAARIIFLRAPYFLLVQLMLIASPIISSSSLYTGSYALVNSEIYFFIACVLLFPLHVMANAWILRAERRTLYDRLAGTKVIQLTQGN